MAATTQAQAIDGEQPGWTREQLISMALLTLLNFSNYLDRAVLAILQEPVKHDLGLKDWQLGLLSGGVFAIFYSVVGIPAARLADRSDRITILSIALAAWSAMTALCGLALNFPQLLLARLGVGAAEGACTPASHSIVSDTFPPHRRGLTLAIITASNPVSKMVAPIVGGAVAMAYGWRAAFFVVGLPGIALAIAIRLLMRDRHHHARHRSSAARTAFLSDMRELLGQANFRYMLCGSAMMSMGVVSTDFFTGSYLLRSFDVSLKQAGFALAAGPGLAGLFGTFLGGYLGDRLSGESGRSYSYVCAIGAAFAAVFFSIAFSGVALAAVIPLILIANLMLNMKNGANFAAAQNMAPARIRATAAAILMLFIIVIGNGFGPLLTGGLSDYVASSNFPAQFGEFGEICKGGKAVVGSSALVQGACGDATRIGLQRALLLPCLAYALSALFFWLAGRRTHILENRS